MLKNVILFTGPNTVFLERDLLAWKKQFIEKHGEINLLEVHADDLDGPRVISECLTPGFMGGYRMIILHDTLATKKKESAEEKPFGESFLEIMSTIPAENIIIFKDTKPDKRTKLFKGLSKEVTVKSYEEPNDFEIKNYLKTRLPNLEPQAASALMNYKKNSLPQIENELRKLELYKPNTPITQQDIESFISPDLENQIFDLVDQVLSGNTKQALKEFRVLLETEPVFVVFASLMGNLRKILFALTYLNAGKSSDSIAGTLGIHPFVIKKNARFAKQSRKLKTLFDQLSKLDHLSKTGGIPGDTEASLTRAMESILIKK